LAALSRQGDANDLLVIANIAPYAPSASRDLDGNLVFRTSRPDLCREADIGADAARSFAVERWLAARRVQIAAASIGACSGRDFRATDAAFIRRGGLATLEGRFQGGMSQAFDAGTVELIVLEQARERQAADRALSQSRLASGQSIQDGRAGAGYLVFENQASNACYILEDNAAEWQNAVNRRTEELQIDLAARLQFRAVQFGSNDAFIAARRGECRIIVGEAANLRRILAAAQRDRLAVQIGAVWLEAAAAPPAATASSPVVPGIVGAGAERLRSPFMEGIENQGSPGDLLLLVNTSSSAPNATVNLSGEIVFLSGRATMCAVPALRASLTQQLALEDWFQARRVAFSSVTQTACGSGELTQIDAVLVRRGEMTRLEPALFNSIARAASGRAVKDEAILTEAAATAQREAIAAEVERNRHSIEAGRDGMGAVVFVNSGRQICVIAEGGPAALQRLIRDEQRNLELELDQRGPFDVVFQDADAAYVSARRGSCRLIVASTTRLQAVLTASTRDAVVHAVGRTWLTPAAVSRIETAIQSEAAARLQQEQLRNEALQQERQQREIRDRNLGVELARRTEALRNASRARAVVMQDQVRDGVRDLFSGAQTRSWVEASFPIVESVSSRRRSEGWELQAVEASVYEYGISQWSGRMLPTAVIEVTIRVRNSDIGRHDTLCFLTGHQEDTEFRRIRSSEAVACGDTGAARIRAWLSSLNFDSQWNARP
jgi:hypothetical protein